MAEQNTESVYKVTVVNAQGTPLVAYVKESSRRSYVRSMREEYGNAKVELVEPSDIPEGIDL